MTNSEVWYPIKETDLKDLISSDKILLRKIFEVPQSTPTCLLYLETGEIPLQDIIKSRRIKYLHYLLNSPPGEMLTNVFKAQMRNPLKDDWIEIVKKDLKDFNINESLEEITEMKEDLFKKKVTKACRNYSFKKLVNSIRSKGNNLVYNELKMQNYLVSNKLNSNEAKFLFKIRCRMLGVKENFKDNFKNNLTCQPCLSHTDTQEGILTCSALNNEQNTTKYNDLFSQDLDIVVPALKQFRALWRKRETILSNRTPS